MPLRIGETFAGYRVLRLLGSGGMGEVYLVQHPRLPRREALKVLRPDISGDASFRDRFIREADLAAGLRHPHIVGVHDRGEHEGQLWISMDYIDGTDLGQLVEQRYPAGMPVELVMLIVNAVASALDYAHKKGLLHRDIKPANILVADLGTDDPTIFLTDFGIARPLEDTNGLTTTNMTVGTVAYAAPEQLMGEPMDGRADQYALAATCYHLLTGAQLFPNSNPAVVISRHLNTTPPKLGDCRPDCARLDDVLQIALAKNPADRFSFCLAFTQALTAASHGQTGVSANATTQAVGHPRSSASKMSARLPKPATTRSRLVLGGFASTIVLIAVIGVLWRPWLTPQSNTTAISSTGAAITPTTSPTPSAPTSSAQEHPPATHAEVTPSLVRTPTVSTPGDELPNIDGADWAGFSRAMKQGLSPQGYELMSSGVIFNDSAVWVCDWHTQGADPSTVQDRLVGKYNGLSHGDASVIYRSAIDWVCPVAGPAPTPTVTVTTPASNPNGPGCSSQHPDKCGPWTPEQAVFACRAVLGGADYTADLKRMLMNRYGLDENSAFFLGKEAMYSLNSGGAYIPPPSNAEGFHPLCNDIVP